MQKIMGNEGEIKVWWLCQRMQMWNRCIRRDILCFKKKPCWSMWPSIYSCLSLMIFLLVFFIVGIRSNQNSRKYNWQMSTFAVALMAKYSFCRSILAAWSLQFHIFFAKNRRFETIIDLIVTYECYTANVPLLELHICLFLYGVC